MIRYATRADIPVIAHMLRLLHEESPVYREVPINEAHTLARLTQLIDECPTGNGVVLVEPGKGFILGTIGTTFWDDRPVLCEQLLYVLPVWRDIGTLARDLIREFESVGKYNNCHRVIVGASTGIANEVVAKLYERMGYRRKGISMWKDIECATSQKASA